MEIFFMVSLLGYYGPVLPSSFRGLVNRDTGGDFRAFARLGFSIKFSADQLHTLYHVASRALDVDSGFVWSLKCITMAFPKYGFYLFESANLNRFYQTVGSARTFLSRSRRWDDRCEKIAHIANQSGLVFDLAAGQELPNESVLVKHGGMQ